MLQGSAVVCDHGAARDAELQHSRTQLKSSIQLAWSQVRIYSMSSNKLGNLPSSTQMLIGRIIVCECKALVPFRAMSVRGSD